MSTSASSFGKVLDYPDGDASTRFNSLVGIDEIKETLIAEASILIDPQSLSGWSERHHGQQIRAVDAVSSRPPLIVLAGDVGTGKTALAESVGDPIARKLSIDMLNLYPLSLNARGSGLVGEMSTLVTGAFAEVRTKVAPRPPQGRATSAAIILIDEADALAQSRDLTQMHHEDRAGVNALIRSIDDVARDRLPILTIMCTNRVDALDPAILRRAARVLQFHRPDATQRAALIADLTSDAGIGTEAVAAASEALGAQEDRPWGATYSDIRQRLIPELLLAAFQADEPITDAQPVVTATKFVPTRPFGNRDD